MRATMKGTPIQGVFYPSDDAAAVRGPGVGAVLPKVLAVLAGVVLLRTLAAGRGHPLGHAHGPGGGGHSRRREALARLHRELHAADEAAGPDTEVTT